MTTCLNNLIAQCPGISKFKAIHLYDFCYDTLNIEITIVISKSGF